MCLFVKYSKKDVNVVDGYVDSMLITGTSIDVVKCFFREHNFASDNDLSVVHQFQSIRITLDGEAGIKT